MMQRHCYILSRLFVFDARQIMLMFARLGSKKNNVLSYRNGCAVWRHKEVNLPVKPDGSADRVIGPLAVLLGALLLLPYGSKAGYFFEFGGLFGRIKGRRWHGFGHELIKGYRVTLAKRAKRDLGSIWVIATAEAASAPSPMF